MGRERVDPTKDDKDTFNMFVWVLGVYLADFSLGFDVLRLHFLVPSGLLMQCVQRTTDEVSKRDSWQEKGSLIQ